jgi:hypothetical protein
MFPAQLIDTEPDRRTLSFTDSRKPEFSVVVVGDGR